jgi:hypothetical protein
MMSVVSPGTGILLVVPILRLRENGNIAVPYHVTCIADFISMIELAIRSAFSPGEWIDHWILLGASIHPVPVVGVRNDVLFLFRWLGVETKPRGGVCWAC